MGIGASVFLLAIGAILAFAVDYTLNGLDLNVVGVILMAAGVLGLFMTTLVFGRRDRAVSAGTGTGTVVTEERVVRNQSL